MQDHLAVGPGVVGPAGHRLEVVLPLLRVDRRARQLAVRQFDAGLAHRALHDLQVVGGDLVPRAPGAAVHRDGHLALAQPERLGRLLVEDLLHEVDLQEVVPAAERADLRYPSLLGLVAHLGRIGGLHPAPLLGGQQVLLPPVAALHRPFRAVPQHIVEAAAGELDDALGAHPGGHVLEQEVYELLDVRPDVIGLQVGADQPDAAVGDHHPVGDEVVGVRNSEVVHVTVVGDLLDRGDLIVQVARRLELPHLILQEVLERHECDGGIQPCLLIVMPLDEAGVDVLARQERLHLLELQPLGLQIPGPLGRLDLSPIGFLLEQ